MTGTRTIDGLLIAGAMLALVGCSPEKAERPAVDDKGKAYYKIFTAAWTSPIWYRPGSN